MTSWSSGGDEMLDMIDANDTIDDVLNTLDASDSDIESDLEVGTSADIVSDAASTITFGSGMYMSGSGDAGSMTCSGSGG